MEVSRLGARFWNTVDFQVSSGRWRDESVEVEGVGLGNGGGEERLL